MELIHKDNKLEKFLDKWTSKKSNYFASKDNENIKKARVQLISNLIKIIKTYSHDSPNKRTIKKIEKYSRTLDSINGNNFLSKIFKAEHTKESEEEYKEFSKSIVYDNMEYILAHMNLKFYEANRRIFEFYRNIKKQYLMGLITHQFYHFNEIRLRLNILDKISNKSVESVFQKTNVNQEFLNSKDVYRLKRELIEKLIEILVTEQKELKEKNIHGSKKLEEKISLLENNLKSIEKEVEISKKREKLFHLKWENFQQFIRGQVDSLTPENSKIIQLSARYNQCKRDFEENLISKNKFEEEYLNIQLACVSFLENNNLLD